MATGDIITLSEAKDFLNITSSDSDSELAKFISRASQAWVAKVGPVAGSPTFSEWYDGGHPTIVLRHTPVQSITSVTEALTATNVYTLSSLVLDGTGVSDNYAYSFDQESGVLTRRMAGLAANFAAGIRNIHVTYVAGYATTPDDIKMAVADIARDMWQTQRGAGRSRGSSADNESPPVGLWPRRAQDIANTYLVPGIA